MEFHQFALWNSYVRCFRQVPERMPAQKAGIQRKNQQVRCLPHFLVLSHVLTLQSWQTACVSFIDGPMTP